MTVPMPAVIAELLRVDDTGVVANYIRQLHARLEAKDGIAVRAFVRTVRERATRLQRLYRSPRAEAIHEALETSATEVGE